MNRNPDELDRMLDQTLDEIRGQALPARTEQEAAARVWARVSVEARTQAPAEEEAHRIRDCSDFRALIPAYLRNGLNDAKTALLEDHVTTCLPCRKALKEARTARQRSRVESAAPVRGGWVSTWTWRVAAAAAIVVGLIGLSVKTDVLTLQTGGVIRIEAVDGEAVQVTGDGTVPLKAGDTVSFEDARAIRTGKDANLMLRLADDSRVEMSERAELSVQDRRKIWSYRNPDAVIELGRGSVIVEASDQGSGHLYVDTTDASVAVTGTVFAVNSGMKGSRVTVVEGEVQVAWAGHSDMLRPGEQATTNPGLGRVPVAEELAWSRQIEKHLALLAQFAELGREIDRQVEGPGLRYGTALLDRVPADTVVYVAIPNLSGTLGQAYDLMQSKISSNDLLREWWNDSVVSSGADGKIELAMSRIRSYGRQIGDEIVVAVSGVGRRGTEPDVLILAQAGDEAALAEQLRADLAGLELAGDSTDRPDITLLDETLSADAQSDLYVGIANGFVVLSPRIESIRGFAATARSAGASTFYGSSFHRRLADLYGQGVEWVIGVDVQGLRQAGDASETDAERDLEALGILDLQHVIGQHAESAGRSETRAELSFDKPRRGVAAWLAPPSAMGSLDFISSNAYFAAGFVMKEPAQVVDEMLGFFAAEKPEFLSGLEEFERESSIDVRGDLAAAIGGEFAFAVDGPVLPKPSWKLVVEVYDPARLQSTIEWAVGRINQAVHDGGMQGFGIERLERGGRTYYELRSLDTGIAAHYTFVDGYMIAAASRALIDRALQYRDNGLSLAMSRSFVELLPHDSEINFSAVVYQNWGPVLRPLSEGLAKAGPSLGAEARGLLDHLGSFAGPSLTLAYGEQSRITLVNTTEGGLLGRGLASILSLDSLLSVQQLLDQAAREQADPRSGSDDPLEPDVRAERTVIEG